MKETLLPIARIRDYEFLGLYKPKEDSDLFFYVYDIELDNNITDRIFHSSVHNQVLMKGDIVEYEYNSKNNLVVRIPKRKPVYISHEKTSSKPTVKELLERRKQREKQNENNQNK